MSLLEQPYFAALRARLDLLSQRHKLISENVANASTPGYVPRDIDTSRFDRALMTAMQSAGRSGGSGAAVSTSLARIVKSPDTETTLDGNAVELEDQDAPGLRNLRRLVPEGPCHAAPRRARARPVGADT